MNQNIIKTHVLLKQISKQQLKYVVFQNIICGFLLQVLTTPPTLPKNFVSNNPPLFSRTLFFSIVPSHITMIKKTTRIQNSN
jgi:hypothetical protein